MKYILWLMPIYLLLASCASTNSSKSANNEQVQVYIEQNGKQLDVSGHKVFLKKAPFNMVTVLPQPTSVMVHASFDNGMIQDIEKGAELLEFSCFNDVSNVAAVGLFNPDKTLEIIDGLSSPYYYESASEHTCNEVQIEGDKILCTRAIEKIYIDAGSELLDVSEISVPIFVVMAPSYLIDESAPNNLFSGAYFELVFVD